MDDVPENRHNIEKLLDSLNLPNFREDFQITCDLKLIKIVAGIQSCSSLYSCPYCEGSKVSNESGKPTSGRGKWKAGDLRTFGSIAEHQSKWREETNGNRKLLKEYKSCEFPPIKFSNHLQEAEVLFTLPPDPLHNNLLGAGNDACDCLEKHF